MAKLHFLCAVILGASAVFSSSAIAQKIDIDYLKKTNPELYKQLMAVELCRKEPQSTSCQAADSNKNSSGATQHQTEAAPKSAQPTGQWWYDSAYEQGLDDQWQHALQVTADLAEMSGNIEGEEFHIEVDYFSRVNAWTNLLTLIYEKDDVKQSGIQALDKKHYAFNYGGRYDFNETWFGQGGYIIEQDTSRSLDRQQVLYAGVGMHIIATDRVNLSSMLAVGEQHDEFINQDAVGIGSLDYSVAYFVEQLSWHLTKTISIKQSFTWLQSLESLPEPGPAMTAGNTVNPMCVEPPMSGSEYCIIGNSSKSKLGFTLGLQYQINAFMSLLYNYSYEKDNTPWVGVEGTDKSNSISVRVRF